MNQARFQKQQREKARREKAAAKRERRAERAEAAEAEGDPEAPSAAQQQDVLAELAALHARFEDDKIEFDDFEEKKQELLERLHVQ